MRKEFFPLLVVIFIFLVNHSCGIDEIPVLSKPDKGTTSEILDTFEFSATSRNNELDFRGFEVYYKFLSTDTETGVLNTQLNYTTISDLESSNFRRISYYINEDECDRLTRISKPLIKVPPDNRGDEAVITITFQDLDDVYISSEPEDFFSIPTNPDPLVLPIRRGIEDEEDTGFYKPFEDYRTYDADVFGITSLAENRVYILLYVLSYGRYNLSETVYSDALSLGYITLESIVVLE